MSKFIAIALIMVAVWGYPAGMIWVAHQLDLAVGHLVSFVGAYV
jgi:hypothetical protein